MVKYKSGHEEIIIRGKKMSVDLENKNILVTGATGNLGPYLTDTLIDEGAEVLATYRSDEELEEATGRAENSDEVNYFKVDLLDPEAISDFKSEVEEEYGKLDAMVNLVGGFTLGGLQETSKDQFVTSLNVHTTTVFLTVKEFSDHLEENKGSVVNFSSVKVQDFAKGAVSYTAGKGALTTLTNVLNVELDNTRVNAVAPDTMDVPGNREAMPDANFEEWTDRNEVLETVKYLLKNKAVDGELIRN